MPAAQESRLNFTRLGVIAGGGDLPARILSACDTRGIEPFVIAFEDQTDPATFRDRAYLLTRLGAAGSIIKTLKAHGIRDLVFIGSIRRPSLKEMRPDFRTIQFFAKLTTRALGDDGLLKAMKDELAREGFRIHGAQLFAEDLLASPGCLGRAKPGSDALDDIRRGLDVLRTLGPLDIGQGVVVQDGIVLGVEAIEGTSDLIRRCGALRRDGNGPILVKMSKPGQDQDLDLPTIGPDTVLAAGESGFAGIVIEAGHTLVLDPEKVSALADEFGLFVLAIDAEKGV